jgi:transcription factor E
MLNKFLKEIVTSLAGKQSEGIIDLFDGKKYVNEFIIAKKLNLTINQTRNILYKISDYGLVSFIRKKDKKKGWYTYFWKIEILKNLEFLRENLLKKMEQIQHQIASRKTKEFYVCEKCNIEFNEETALVHNFMCNECGEIMSRKDNAPAIKEYNKELYKLRKELELVDEELRIEKEKLEKSKAREMKKEEKLKLEEKRKKKLAAPAKKKTAKKQIKEKSKVSKKKSQKIIKKKKTKK